MTIPVTICDDSSFARKQIARALPEHWDINVTFTCNGVEGLEAVRQKQAEVLFLDLTMPEMDGFEVLSHIFNEQLNSIVIVVSGDIQPEARDRVISLGAIAFIKKPFSTEEITEILQKFGLMNELIEGSNQLLESIDSTQITLQNVYQEIANIAMGRAADLLARHMDAFIALPVPSVNTIEVSELKMALQSIVGDQQMLSVFQGFIGKSIAGEALLIFNNSSFTDIAKLLKYEGNIDSKVEAELMMDIASILIGTFLKSFAEQLDIQFSQGHPKILQDGHIADLLRPDCVKWKQTLSIEINYRIEGYDVNCDLLLLFTEDSISELNSRVSYYAS
jgi:chemotaxis protein CheY-P-specific phosphatase CheC